MISKLFSAAILGLEAVPIEIEADISSGLPAFTIVGLPDKSIEESKERVRAALKNSGVTMPAKRITINLAPADIKKEGPAYDLPIALSLIIASGVLENTPEKSLFVGELSLNGDLRPITGMLPIAIMAKEKNFRQIFLPAQNAPEASLISGLEIYPLKSITELISHFKDEQKIALYKKTPTSLKARGENVITDYDFAYIKGQEQAKRALEIAAAGMHNALMFGPPGGGKTMLAKALPTILPKMTEAETLAVSKIYSVAGLLSPEKPLITERPFRSPHHTASDIALVGGGQKPRPGEITLAHQGVLFLDEIPEFNRSVLEALRQPLEDRIITVSRAQGTITFPANFILVASMNPCPCGYLNDPIKQCVCSASQIIRYQKKISGPLLDRIDMHLEVPRVKYEKLADEKVAEESKKIRARVEKAKAIQLKRFAKEKITNNAEMRVPHLKKYCPLSKDVQLLLKQAVNQLSLSARSYHRVIKLARTIADLENSPQILARHIAEALQYRPKEITY